MQPQPVQQVVYVNQNGQPIQQPAQQVVYVDQNGQPIQPAQQPVTVVQQPATSAVDTTFNVTQESFIGTQLPARSTTTVCPSCKQSVKTKCKLTQGLFFWIIFCGLWLFCCCCVAFCIPDIMDAKHTCPNCNHVIGERKIVS